MQLKNICLGLITCSPPFLASSKRTNGLTRRRSWFYSPGSQQRRSAAAAERTVGLSAQSHWRKNAQGDGEEDGKLQVTLRDFIWNICIFKQPVDIQQHIMQNQCLVDSNVCKHSPDSWRHLVQLTINIQVSVSGGNVAVADRQDLLSKTQIIHLHTHTHTSRFQSVVVSSALINSCCDLVSVLLLWYELTILSVLEPTAPAGRIPLGPCSNTAPSDLRVDHSQPPKRLLASRRMTCLDI